MTVTLTVGPDAAVTDLSVDRTTINTCVREVLVGQRLGIWRPAGKLAFPYVLW